MGMLSMAGRVLVQLERNYMNLFRFVSIENYQRGNSRFSGILDSTTICLENKKFVESGLAAIR
jgi:hypothetical protein